MTQEIYNTVANRVNLAMNCLHQNNMKDSIEIFDTLLTYMKIMSGEIIVEEGDTHQEKTNT